MDIVQAFVLLARAGVELAPIVEKLVTRQQIEDRRQDITDEQRAQTRALIVALQQAINQQ